VPDRSLISGVGCHPPCQELFLQCSDASQREALGGAPDYVSYRFSIPLGEIAILGVTDATIKTHASTIFAKLGVRDRVRAVLKGLEIGYV
jgi:hypothetical protein